MSEVVKAGNQAAIDRLEQQFSACERTFTIAGAAALPFDTA